MLKYKGGDDGLDTDYHRGLLCKVYHPECKRRECRGRTEWYRYICDKQALSSGAACRQTCNERCV